MTKMVLRPYQGEAVAAIEDEWKKGVKRTLLVLPTGTGKTICFAKVTEDCVRMGDRVLILAHRGELLDQARDKIAKATGLGCSIEKAEESCLDSFFRVTVGSVQTLMRPSRLERFKPDYFNTIIIDEAHHALSPSYRNVLDYFDKAKVLGVTATPERGDLKNLGEVFDTLAYEYRITQAIKQGYLCRIKALTIPLKLDISKVGISAGDYKVGEIGTALDPYLDQIADQMAEHCMNRKTVVFLPLIATSQKFRDILNDRGFRAAEVNGESMDRAEILADFEAGKYNVLCNSMLLTEGWDCPSVDCIVVLRPTKVRGLYCLDCKTEILTDNGWLTEVHAGDRIRVFDPETGRIKTDTVKAAIRRPLEQGEYFCSYEGPQASIRVTNKHRMLYDNKRNTGWKFKTAEELCGLKDGAYIPVSGWAEFDGVQLTDAELRFIGWFLSDGTLDKSNNAIYISQAKHQPWIKDLEACIRECGFKYGKREISGGTAFNETSPRIVYSISHGQPRGRDKHLEGWKRLEPYIDKNVSKALFDMTEEQFDLMLEAIHLGNGAKQENQSWTRRSYHISTPYREQAENLQIMAIQRGWKANIFIDSKGRDKPLYVLHMKKKGRAYIGSKYDGRPTWTMEPHTNEYCWCVETDTGTLITRRNGKVAIMGNCQMVGRGTRLSPGKDHLLLLDFLWMVEKHELCRPASLICESPDVAEQMTKNLEESAGTEMDLEEAEQKASEDVVAQREEALAKELAAMRTRKRKLVDPLQFEMSIQAEDLSGYVPSFGWEMAPASDKQKQTLEKFGIFPESVENAGKAAKILDRLHKRREEGLTTPKQIRFLENKGFQHVGTWQFDEARRMIDRIAGNGWRIPRGIYPVEYIPPSQQRVMFNE